MKKIMSALIAGSILALSGTGSAVQPVTANTADTAMPMAVLISNIDAKISANSSTSVHCISTASGSNLTKLEITQTLQRLSSNGSWTDRYSKMKTFYSSSATYENDFGSLTSGTYRTKTYAKAYKGSSTDTRTYYSTQTVTL